MASLDDCRTALARLAQSLADNPEQVRRKVNLDRTLRCRVTDLGASFHGRLRDGLLVDVAERDADAQITISASSDDLIAMVDGELDFARALATRRVSVQANPLDLWKLRKLL